MLIDELEQGTEEWFGAAGVLPNLGGNDGMVVATSFATPFQHSTPAHGFVL
jgi:hypothetical protein